MDERNFNAELINGDVCVDCGGSKPCGCMSQEESDMVNLTESEEPAPTTIQLKAKLQVPVLEPLGKHFFVDGDVPVYGEDGNQIGTASAWYQDLFVNLTMFIEYSTPERLLIQEKEVFYVFPVWKSRKATQVDTMNRFMSDGVILDEIMSLTFMGKSMGVLVAAERVEEEE